jgi:hypothetical protein
MNIPSDKVEQLLRKAPRPATPAGLLEDLRAEILLPRTTAVQNHSYPHPSLFRRWLPVLSLSLWLLACLVLLGVQVRYVAALKAENAQLLSATRGKATSNVALSTTTAADDLNRLRAEHEEVTRLRAEVQQLQGEVATLSALRAENQRLAKELQAQGNPGAEEDFITAAAEKGERTKCINNLKQVMLAAIIYSRKHGGVMPADFETMRNEIRNEGITYCPANEGTVRYEIVSPGETLRDSAIVFARCHEHNHAALMDGSVHQLGPQRKVGPREDGKMVIIDKINLE